MSAAADACSSAAETTDTRDCGQDGIHITHLHPPTYNCIHFVFFLLSSEFNVCTYQNILALGFSHSEEQNASTTTTTTIYGLYTGQPVLADTPT